jgi:imidazolonepropionase-like amidohydrolase
MRIVHLLLFSTFFLHHANGQTYAIIADRLIDVKNGKEISHPTVVVYHDKITEININRKIPDSAVVIDLTGFTILPGLMDVHTHLLTDGSELSADLYRNSPSFRSLRAVQHLSTALHNGYTTIRDMCTEGAGYADVDISRAIDSGYIDGPRVFTSGKGIAATGGYLPRPSKQNWSIVMPAATEYVSGVPECLRVVREQLNSGVDWIKMFSDWGPDPTFTYEEIKAIVDEAGKYPLPVAAHAKSKQGIRNSINAGVRSIEHGDAFDDSLIQLAIRKNVYWCPTLTWQEFFGRTSVEKYRYLKKAYALKMKIVSGSDVGSFPWTVNQAKELQYLVEKAGMSPMDAIRAATLHAASLLNIQDVLGSIEKGYLADIIAVKGNPLEDITELQRVHFVMKDGKVYKNK